MAKTADFISHKKLEQYSIDPEELPIVNDYRGFQKCAVCGAQITEYHHWAPRHLFGSDADKWPIGYLCPKHHAEWHDKVTPEMSRKKHET